VVSDAWDWRVIAVALSLAVASFGYGGMTSYAAIIAIERHITPVAIYLTTYAISLVLFRVCFSHLGDRIGPTLVLLGISTVLSAAIGIWIGIRGGWRRGKWFDRSSTGITLTLYAMPEFWLGMLLLILLSTGVGALPGWFPSGGVVSPGVDKWSLDGIIHQGWHLVLPVATLTLAYLAEYSLVMRSSVVEELGQDYLKTARAKGLMDRLVRRRHAVPNALLPTLTLVFLNIGFIIYTLGLVTGMVWSYRMTAGLLEVGAKQTGALIAWVLFAILLRSRARRMTIILSAGAFTAVTISILGIAHA
jgi:ABC-type microcin C transport system permease subunit YejB